MVMHIDDPYLNGTSQFGYCTILFGYHLISFWNVQGKKFLPNNFFPWASTIELFTVIIIVICFCTILACITHKSLGLYSQQPNFFETCKWLREARVLYYTRLVCIAIVKRSSFYGHL